MSKVLEMASLSNLAAQSLLRELQLTEELLEDARARLKTAHEACRAMHEAIDATYDGQPLASDYAEAWHKVKTVAGWTL